VADQIKLHAEQRQRKGQGKGAVGRLRKQGRVPGIVYGHEVTPTPVDVDALELYHALHTEAGLNVLIRLEVGGDTHLTVARDLQRHPIKGETLHVDFLAVDEASQIGAEIPIHLADEDDAAEDGGVINQILYSVPILVKPLDVPNYFEMSIAGMSIGDIRRLEDLADQLPEGAEFEVELDRAVVTINAPVTEEELEALEEAAGIEGEEPELVSEEGEEAPSDEDEAPAEDVPGGES